MIFYVVTRQHFYTVIKYFETYGLSLASRPKLLFYDQLTNTSQLPAGTYIFSDIERLSPTDAERAAQVWKDLSKAGEQVRLMNHPTRSLRRYEMLRILYERGFNTFNIYRLTEQRIPQRFPVFIRGENDHAGNLTPLLHTQEELTAAISELWSQGQSRENKVIVEFCDTADASSMFRKYSAFIVGEQIIPAHLIFSQRWMVKFVAAVEDLGEDMLREERHYMETNPHERSLLDIARLADIKYGRIDYSMLNGAIQCWEINTNPQLPLPLHEHARLPAQVPLLDYSMRQLTAAFAAIDCNVSPEIRIDISVRQDKLKALKYTLRGLLTRSYRLDAKRKLKDWQRIGVALLRRGT